MEELKAGVPPTSARKALARIAKAIFNYARKENMKTPRRNLTADEITFVSICFKNIRVDFLNSKQSDFLQSIKQQFDYDGMLSDKQLEVLKNIKRSSDLEKRKKAIARGRLNFVQNDAERTDQKLNTVYNSIGR